MANNIEKSVQSMSTAFDALSNLQGDALSESLENGHDAIKRKFVDITKLDVTLNNYLVRARQQWLGVRCYDMLAHQQAYRNKKVTNTHGNKYP